jgi:hypothetical protein
MFVLDLHFLILHSGAASGGDVGLDFHAATEDRVVSQFLLDAEELVVLGDTVTAGKRAGFDLATVRGDGEVGDGVVLSFT